MRLHLYFSVHKILFFLFGIYQLFLFPNAIAQSPLVKKWDARFGGNQYDWVMTFISTPDGGYLLGGYSASNASGDKTQNNWGSNNHYDYWIVKIDSSGNKQWDKDFGGTDFDYLSAVIQTSDGGYLLGGYSRSMSGGNKTEDTKGLNDYWIVRIDALGNKLWDKDFGGNLDDKLYAIVQTADQGFILAGSSESGINGDKTQITKGGSDYWIVKIDSIGNKQWDTDYGAANIETLASITPSTDNGYLLCGTSNSMTGGDKTQNTFGSIDYWVIKINGTGIKQWDKDFGGTNTDNLFASELAPDSGYLLIGYSSSNIGGNKSENSKGGTDYWVLKIDSLGSKLWDKDYGGTSNDYCRSVSLTQDGGYLFCGDSESGVSGNKTERNVGYSQTWLLKLNASGNLEWNKTIFSLGQEVGSLAIVTGGNYVVTNQTGSTTGYYKSQLSQGGNDYWIIKFRDENCWSTYDTISALICSEYLSPSGNFTWHQSGNYLDLIPNSSGCDSIITFQLTNANTASSFTMAICPGDTIISPSGNYLWTTTGVFKDTILNAAGCDSVMTIVLTSLITTSSISAKTCPAVPYTSPSGNYIWSVPGTYHDTLTNAVNCDSIITVTLSTANTTSYINGMVCSGASYISPSGNYTWNTPGNYLDTILNVMGCDSIITIHLFSGNSYSTISGNACSSHYYISPSGNYSWNVPGTYSDTIPNAIGCDSIISIILSASTSSSINGGVCDSVAYISPSGNYTWNTPGTYYDTIPNSVGCDSVITIHLSTNNSSAIIYGNVCGNTYYVSPSGNYSWNIPGTYYDTISNAIGCDSCITIILTSEATSSISMFGCDNVISPSGNYTWTVPGIYTDTVPSSIGCDSIITITVSLIDIDTSVTTAGLTLTANESVGNYQWIDCGHGYTFVVGASNRSFTPLTDGSYAVIIIRNGCYDTSSCHTVLVNEISTQDLEKQFLSYLNSETDEFIVNACSLAGDHAELKLYDILGKEILSRQLISLRNESAILKLNLSGYKNGIYIFSICGDFKIISGRFVLNH